MTARTLPILNAIGCLALTGLVVVQWRTERSRDQVFADIRNSLVEARSETAEQAKQRAALEQDIIVLKESIEATQRDAESSARMLSESTEINSRLQDGLTAARDQVTTWQSALKTRDERIKELNNELTATRKRLDEAIAKLKTR